MAKLTFNFGTMSSAKSAKLMILRHRYLELSKDVLCFKPSMDTRNGAYINSRAFDYSIPVVVVGFMQEGYMYNLAEEQRPAVVLVDEVQFMSAAQIDELASIVHNLNIPVHAFGLMSDFMLNVFSGSERLVGIGADLVEIETVCYYCDEKAVANMRMKDGVPIFEGEQVQVGDKEYRSVCRSCYYKKKAEHRC